jgi:hypothetical protein
MYTVSSPDKDALIYDENRSFAFFYLENPPEETIYLEVNNPINKDYSLVGAKSSYFFDTDLSNLESIAADRLQMDSRVKLEYSLTNNAFIFYSDCYSSARF